MKLLLITNMHPSKQKPYSGLFVVNQFCAIKNELSSKDELGFYYMERSFTNVIGSIFKYIKFFFGFFIFIWKEKVKYDIIHVHYYYPTIYLALIYKFLFNHRCKLIITFHGGDFYKTKKNFLFKYPLRKINRIIAVSNDLRKSLQKYYEEEILVLSAGINTIFTPPENKVDKKFDLIYVGSFYEVKGFDILCNVLRNYSNNLSICLIGSGHLEDQVKEVAFNSNISFELNNNLTQQEIVKKLHQSKFLINLSRNESFGLSMTEAMACGIPVLASKTDGSTEQIKEGYNGFFLQDLIEKNISEKITEILNIPKIDYSKMSSNAISSSSKYKLPYISTSLIKEYKNLING